MAAPTDNFFRHVARCPLCGATNKDVNILLVQKRADRTGLHLTCPSCRTSMIVFLSQSGVGVVSVGTVTDVGRDDVALLQDGDTPFSADTVLDLHLRMARHDGPLSDLLTSRRATVRRRAGERRQ